MSHGSYKGRCKCGARMVPVCIEVLRDLNLYGKAMAKMQSRKAQIKKGGKA